MVVWTWVHDNIIIMFFCLFVCLFLFLINLQNVSNMLSVYIINGNFIKINQ